MNNRLKSKTRLAFIQIIFQFLSTKNDVNEIFHEFNQNYKNVFIDSIDNKKIKFEFNSNYLKILVSFYSKLIESKDYFSQIDKHISFNRKFEKWDMINQSILLAALSELQNTENAKIKIIFNDYLNIGKLFIDQTNITTINAILDKIIYDNKR
jgi:transcription termination factor NusB|tara:strand:+ start:644 stop:1102 length:459 start_codon:yes stop_codon:yes gene_type:complete